MRILPIVFSSACYAFFFFVFLTSVFMPEHTGVTA